MNVINELTNSPSAQTQNSLVQAWLDVFQMPDDSTMSSFIRALYTHLEWKQMDLGNKYSSNRFSNHDVTLMAIVKLASGLLVGNKSLMLPTHINLTTLQNRLYRTQAAAREDIKEQLERCCNAGLKYAARNVRRSRIRKRRHAEKMQQALSEMHQIQTDQERWNVDGLSTDDKIQVALKALSKAVKEGKIKLGNAELVLFVLRDGKRQAEIAKLRGISEPAVSQRLRAVAEKLKPVVADSEWP